MVRRPWNRAVYDGLGKDNDITRLAGDVADDLLMCLPLANRRWTGNVAFVRSRYHNKASVPGIHVSQLPGDDGETIVHAAIAPDVVLIRIETGAGRSVEDVALGPFAHRDETSTVIEAIALADDRVQVGHQSGMA